MSSPRPVAARTRSEEHTSELQSHSHLVCRLLLEKKKNRNNRTTSQRHHYHRLSITTHVLCLSISLLLVGSYSMLRLLVLFFFSFFFFFFNDTATPEIYTLSLHDALPICICTSFPEFATHFFDVVCAGGVECAAAVIADYERGSLKRVYRSPIGQIGHYTVDYGHFTRSGISPSVHLIEA